MDAYRLKISGVDKIVSNILGKGELELLNEIRESIFYCIVIYL